MPNLSLDQSAKIKKLELAIKNIQKTKIAPLNESITEWQWEVRDYDSVKKKMQDAEDDYKKANEKIEKFYNDWGWLFALAGGTASGYKGYKCAAMYKSWVAKGLITAGFGVAGGLVCIGGAWLTAEGFKGWYNNNLRILKNDANDKFVKMEKAKNIFGQIESMKNMISDGLQELNSYNRDIKLIKIEMDEIVNGNAKSGDHSIVKSVSSDPGQVASGIISHTYRALGCVIV